MGDMNRTVGLIALALGVIGLAAAAIVFILAYPEAWSGWDAMATEDQQSTTHWLTFTGIPGAALILLGLPLLNCRDQEASA